MDMDLFQPEDIPLQVGERTLTCSCPKCSVKIDLEFAPIDEGTTSYKCPECKAGYVLTRESFARRASRHAGEINCALCGGMLDHSQYCPSCKALYPDYFAAEFPDAAKKRARQSRDLFGGLKNISFQWPSSQTISLKYQPVMMDSEAWQEEPAGLSMLKKKMTAIVAAVVAVALIALCVTYYSHAQTRKKYVASYVVALYGIKTGTDLSLKICKQMSTDATAKGQATPVRALVDDEIQLGKIKSQTDKYLKELNDPPSAFADANEKLQQLNTLYGKLNVLALNPSGTTTSFTEITNKTESDFLATVENLKKSLPPELSEELKVAKTKYRGLAGL
jgi:hypothetical protein